MAITAALVFAGKNRLRYLITATAGGGEAVSIEADGGATPDLLTDTPNAGQLHQIVNVKTAGYGKIAAGGISTQAQARALLMSDDAAAQVGINEPTALVWLSQRSTNAAVGGFVVDAVRGPSDVLTPGITITAQAIGTCYVDVFVPGLIGA